MTEADSGAIVFNGRDITHAPPDEIARLGIGQMPGGAGVFPTLSVEENLRAAAWQERRHRSEAEDSIRDILGQFEQLTPAGATGPATSQAGSSNAGPGHGAAGLAQALAHRRAVARAGAHRRGAATRFGADTADAGTAIILVEQSVNVAVSVSDRVYVMDSGEIRFTGSADHVRDHPELLWSIFIQRGESDERSRGHIPAGTEDGAGVVEAIPMREPTAVPPGGDGPQPVLQVSEASVTFGGISALDDVTFEARSGEVVGIIGPNGAGKTTLIDAVSGFTRLDAGRIMLLGRDVSTLSAAARARRRLGRSFQDSSLFTGLSVRDTLAVALERFIDVVDPVNAALRPPFQVDTEAGIFRRVDELIGLFGLERYADAFLSELSTGTRRLVDLAAVVGHAPSVVLLDEPTSGIAQREVEAMAALLREVQHSLDATFVVVEHDIAFVRELADRLVALDRGRVLAEGRPDEVLDSAEVEEAFLGSDPLARRRSGSLPDPAADVSGGPPSATLDAR